MPPIFQIQCRACGFQSSDEVVVTMYVLDDRGTRVICPHPTEDDTVMEVTGLEFEEAEAAGLIRYMRPYLCLTCEAVSTLDRNHDAIQCQACGSGSLVFFGEVEGRACPRCGAASLEREMVAIS